MASPTTGKSGFGEGGVSFGVTGRSGGAVVSFDMDRRKRPGSTRS
jgi:hypothetical protein